MYTILFIIFMHYSNILAQNIDGDIDVNGPEPIVPHTSVNEPALVTLGTIDGCICREIPNKMSVFYGNICKKFPSSIRVKAPVLKFRDTLVEIIHKNDFQMLENLTYMEIESNHHLRLLEPGCFQNMSKLHNLSISFNENLKEFSEDTFSGLINLKKIYLRNNGFINIIDVTRSLSIRHVPKLESLILNRNPLKKMNQNDFLPMENSSLVVLNLVLCQIEKIHPEVLKPLRNLKALRLGENLFSITTITNLINRTIQYGVPLQILNLYEVGFRVNPPKSLLNVIANSNITYLNLGRNHFEHLDDNSFPVMPSLETLVLRDVVTVDITPKAFYGMPKLKYLVLSSNRLTYINEGVLIKTLILLDISSNSYTTETPFDIPDGVFRKMSALQKLVLSFNQIEVLTIITFDGLENLTILELNNANLNTIMIGAFSPLKNLRRLNLENNYIGTDIILTADIFKGLNNLEVLLLGGCHIYNLTSHPSVFHHLPKLYYLGLQRNGLHFISSHQFPPARALRDIDISDNSLTPWNERLFSGLRIKYLNAGQNKLSTVTSAMLDDFVDLDSWDLEGNPIICDCAWYPVLDWIDKVEPLKTNVIASCVSPDKWRRYEVVEYLRYLKNNTDECQYKQLSNKVILISFTTIFTILTTCSVVIGYYYRWNIRYWIFLARKEIRRRHKQIKLRPMLAINNFEYQYDAFVSYSNEDRSFVDCLIDVLENRDPYLKLCVYERDFQIGTVISEAVMRNIATSRRILLVVSDSFAKSQWCRWEMQLAECHQLQEDTEDGLLLIRLGRVTNKNMTPFLKYIMKTRIYLEWDSDVKKEKAFWDKLRITLAAPK